MKKGDKIIAIIIIVIIFISGMAVCIYKQNMKDLDYIVVIKRDGKVIDKFNLVDIDKNKQWKISYENIHYNVIKIENHRIKIVDADCPHKECVKTGWIAKPGEMIVCLPNKVTISIEGKEKEGETDIVTY